MVNSGLWCPQCQLIHPGAPHASGAACALCGCVLTEREPAETHEEAWFCLRGGRTIGPYSLAELRLMAAVGDLRPNDLIWQGTALQPTLALSARTVLAEAPAPRSRTAPPSLAMTPLPGPLKGLEEALKKPRLARFAEPQVPAEDPTITGTPPRTVRPWVATLIVGAMILGLMGIRAIVESQQPWPAVPPVKIEETGEPRTPASAISKPKTSREKVSPASNKLEKLSPRPTAKDFSTLSPQTTFLAAARQPQGKAPEPRADAAAAAQTGSLATVQCTAGWATFGQVLPQGAARDALKLGEIQTQTDVKTRWPDGSIRFAIVTARIPKAGSYPLTSAPVAKGTFAATMPAFWFYLLCGPQGKDAYGAVTSEKPGDDVWLQGPLVWETRQILMLRNEKTKKPHPFLRVFCDFRVYKDGQGRADITVENTLDTRAATAETYTLAIGDGAGKGYLNRADINHPYLTRWRQVYPLDLQASEVTPDLTPVSQAGALPRYHAVVAPITDVLHDERHDILKPGDLSPDMTAHGGRQELAPYPDWAARYLVHKDPKQLQYVLRNGDLAGSWPVHLRKSDGKLPSIDEHPQFWLDPRAEPRNRPLGNLEARGTLIPDVAHQPSLAYIPYLLTGDRYYADEMAFWANYVLLATFQDKLYNARGGNAGLLHSHETRGIGWGLRNLTDAAAYLPDTHPHKKHFTQKVENNLRWLDKYADEHQTPLGSMWHDKRSENELMPPKVWIAPWEQNYVAWAIDHAHKQGFKDGLKHRDRIAKFQLSLFTNGPAFRRDFAAPYVLAVGEKNAAGQFTAYGTFEELFTKNFNKNDKGVDWAGYFGVDARLMLLIALENGWPGAKEAHDFLWPKIAVEPAMHNVPDLAFRAGWAVAPETPPERGGKR